MEYEERICPIQGNYIIASDESFEDILLKESICLESGTINPGDFTVLNGWFTKPCRYAGILPGDGTLKQAVFFLGKGNNNLFETGGVYYDMTIIIDKNRIGKSYRELSFRDSFLRQRNNGTYYWK